MKSLRVYKLLVCALSLLPLTANATQCGYIPRTQVIGPTTKVDDTNVTLTLGGTTTDSLLTSVSFTLGWTGTLAVARGGTGAATVSANTVFGNNTGSTAAPGFQTLVDAQVPDILTLTKASNLTSNGFVKTSGSDGTLSIDTSTYLTGNQTITLSGD